MIRNDYINKLINIDKFYLTSYKSERGSIRIGLSYSNINKIEAYDDNNTRLNISDRFLTAIAVTIDNIESGFNVSAKSRFPGCEKIDGLLKVVDLDLFNIIINVDKKILVDSLLYFNPEYGRNALFLLNKNMPCIYINDSGKYNGFELSSLADTFMRYANESKSILYLPFKSIDIKKESYYVGETKEYYILDYNEKYYVSINKNKESIELPVFSNSYSGFCCENPYYFYINKKDLTVYKTDKSISSKYDQDVISFLKNKSKKLFGLF